MPNTARQLEEKVHQVRWDGDEWQRIVEAAEIMAERDHLDLNPTDIIRVGTRRLVDELHSHRATLKAAS